MWCVRECFFIRKGDVIMNENNILIGICDDNIIHRNLLNSYICKFFNILNYDLLEFSSGEELLTNYPKNIDLLFLEINIHTLQFRF